MQTGLAVFALLFVVACWIFVVGHQLGLSAFDPKRYPIMDAGSLAIAVHDCRDLALRPRGPLCSRGIQEVKPPAWFERQLSGCGSGY